MKREIIGRSNGNFDVWRWKPNIFICSFWVRVKPPLLTSKWKHIFLISYFYRYRWKHLYLKQEIIGVTKSAFDTALRCGTMPHRIAVAFSKIAFNYLLGKLKEKTVFWDWTFEVRLFKNKKFYKLHICFPNSTFSATVSPLFFQTITIALNPP